MGGSTMALSNLNASSAEASNTRALQDLGANAKAVDRAEKALVNYGNMASTVADQSFERDFSTRSAADKMAVQNNAQRMAGIQGQGQMSTNMRNADDNMRMFNSEQQMQGLQGAGMMANTMRGQDDAMRNSNADRRMTGLQGQGTMVNSMRQSDDAMRNANANRRMGGLEGQGNMLNSMRQSDDSMRQHNSNLQIRGAEGQATVANQMRTADDAMRTFNKEQSMIQSRHIDNYAAEQQKQAWDRGTDMSDAQFRQSENMATRADQFSGRQMTATENAWNRTARTTETGVQMNRDYMDGYDRLTGRSNEAARDNASEIGRGAEFELERGRLATEAEREARGHRATATTERHEEQRAEAARVAAKEQQEDQQRHENSFDQQGILGFLGF
jgi:hypothetical protein